MSAAPISRQLSNEGHRILNDHFKPVGESTDSTTTNEATPPSFCERRVVSFSKSYGNITLREFSNMSCDGSDVIVGFHDESQAALLTASVIVEQLGLSLIGEVISSDFPSICVIHNSIPSGSCRIYGNNSIVVIQSELKITGAGDIIFRLSEAIFDFCSRHNCNKLIAIEGIKEKLELPPGVPMPRSDAELMRLIARISEEREKSIRESNKYPSVMFFTTDLSAADELTTGGHKPMTEAAVGGITGSLIHYSVTSTVPFVCIFPYFSPIIPDGRATIAAVPVISHLTRSGLNIDTTLLEKQAQELQAKLKGAMRDMIAGPANPPDLGMYA